MYKKKADWDILKALDKLRYLKLSTWNQVDAYYQKCEEKYKVALDKWMKAEAYHAITEDSAPSDRENLLWQLRKSFNCAEANYEKGELLNFYGDFTDEALMKHIDQQRRVEAFV